MKLVWFYYKWNSYQVNISIEAPTGFKYVIQWKIHKQFALLCKNMVWLTNLWIPQKTQQFAIYVMIPMIIHKKNNRVNTLILNMMILACTSNVQRLQDLQGNIIMINKENLTMCQWKEKKEVDKHVYIRIYKHTMYVWQTNNSLRRQLTTGIWDSIRAR